MKVYISTMLISVFFAYIAVYFRKKREIFNDCRRKEVVSALYISFSILSFLPLYIVSAIRYDVGTDYLLRYVPGFYKIYNTGKESFELGYMLLNKFVLLFTKDYLFLFIITSFIFCFFIYKTIYENSKDVCYSILLLVFTTSYFVSLNIVRQCIAAALFVYSVKYIRTKDLKKYLIFNGIGILFHSSAIICLPVYFIANKLNLKVHLCSFAAIILARPIINKAFIFFVNLTKYDRYYESKYYTQKIYVTAFIIELAVLILCYMVYKEGKDNERYVMFTNIQFVCVFLLLISSVIPNISRIILYFQFVKIVYLPEVIGLIKSRKLYIITKICVISCYAMYMINEIIIKGSNQVLPYYTIFDRLIN